MEEQILYRHIFNLKETLSAYTQTYWMQYSSIDTWFFWMNVATIVIPLIVLYFYIDKKRLFEVCFFGYTAHVVWSNIDRMLSSYNLLVHPHSLTHVLLIPGGITVTTALFPVTFMLLYQHCTAHNKHFWLYAIAASIVFSYGFGGLSLLTDLLRMHKWMNLTYLLFIDVFVVFISYWATKGFLFFKYKT
ncbi:hypothetical protein SAMN05192534_101374 [Alteribacillus persepolensis]|uniref:Uncharacterized protein n=1 Tax=Alteribacillus persepolensis TaxID=568899 RepID=A0A1G7Z2G4_9BACI|nr:hypothetical protein [Alteribacillus persepolensis]SDH02883.1 hypothetical protein SAMN05192534_101374 [Alteribacillus persepolensis]